MEERRVDKCVPDLGLMIGNGSDELDGGCADGLIRYIGRSSVYVCACGFANRINYCGSELGVLSSDMSMWRVKF
jgi:hypothetical protein